MFKIISIFISITFTSSLNFFAAELSIESGYYKKNMIELYSSESCSSCPPADRWISKFKSDKDLWLKIIPIVFHVDYWNYLDWKDEYSQHLMTERQVQIAKTWTNNSVYTPAVILNGVELKNWKTNSIKEAYQKTNWNIKLEKKDKYIFNVKLVNFDKIDKEKLNIYAAILGFDIETNVLNGENKGKKLTHNFLVLDWQNQASEEKNRIFNFDFKDTIFKNKFKKLAIVIWIEKDKVPIAIQSLGSFL